MPTSLALSHAISINPTLVAVPTTTTAISGIWGPYLPLAAGDSGVRSITSTNWSAVPTGTLCYVLTYPIAFIAGPFVDSITVEVETLGERLVLPRVYDGAHLGIMVRGFGVGAGSMHGGVQFVYA